MTAAPRDPRARVRPAFSIWAWLALTPYLLTAFSGTDLATGSRQLTFGLLAAAVVHGVLLLAFLLVGALERATGRWPWLRWSIVAVALLAIAEGRPALLSHLQHRFGFDIIETDWHLRFLMNATVLTAAVLLIHAVIETIARAREAERRLRVVLDALESEHTRLVSMQRSVGAAFQRELMTEVLDAVGGLLHRGLPPDNLAKELRWIARSVVRRVAEQARTARLGDALDDTGAIPIPGPGAEATSGPPVPRLPTPWAGPAWAITGIALLLFLPPALHAYGPLVGALQLLLASVVSQVLAMAIRRIPRPATRARSIAALAAMYLVVGGIYCWILIRQLGDDPLRVYYFVYGTIGYALVATVVSLIDSSLRRLREHEERAAAALAESERRRFEAQRALVTEGAQAGQLLDIDVQADILATSFRLEAGTAPSDALDELIDRIESTLRGRPSEPLDFVPLLRDSLHATLEAWSLVLDIAADIGDDTLDWLAEHPGSAAVAHDVLTEGLTNAVRFGRGRSVAVRLRRHDDEVEVVVRNPGRIGPRGPEGLGLRDLEQRAREVVLLQDGGHVELRVRLESR